MKKAMGIVVGACVASVIVAGACSASSNENAAVYGPPSEPASQESTASSSASSSLAEKGWEIDGSPIDIYDIESAVNYKAASFQSQLKAAERWGADVAGGDVVQIWAYADALDAIETGQLVGEVTSWQNAAGAEAVDDKSVAGYAIDGRVVCVNFGWFTGEKWIWAFFDGNGKLMYVRERGELINGWVFKDDVLVSHTAGFAEFYTSEPQVIGRWDEDDRLAQQERLLDLVRGNYGLLRVDDMIAVESGDR